MADWRDYTGDDSKALVACFFLVPFTCWVLQEVFERKCGMEPQIYSGNSLKKLAERIQYRHRQSETFGDVENIGNTSISTKPEMIGGVGNESAGLQLPFQTSQSTSGNAQTTRMQILISKAVPPSIDGSPVSAPAGSAVDLPGAAFAGQTLGTPPDTPPGTPPGTPSGTPNKNSKMPQLTKDSHIIPMRLTKSVDKKGRYRMTVRSSVYAVKAIMFFILLSYSITAYFVFPGFYKSLFWDLDARTFKFGPLRASFVYIMAFYLWELTVNRYGKISWSVIAHHVVVCLVVCEVLLFDVFLPFIVMYGIFGVGTTFGLYGTLSLRASKWASRRATLVRRLSTVSYWSYLISNMIINISGNVFLVINGVITGNIAVFSLFTISISIFIWLYDDFKLLGVLKQFAQQHYETAVMLQGHAMVSTHDILKENTLRIDTELSQQFAPSPLSVAS